RSEPALIIAPDHGAAVDPRLIGNDRAAGALIGTGSTRYSAHGCLRCGAHPSDKAYRFDVPPFTSTRGTSRVSSCPESRRSSTWREDTKPEPGPNFSALGCASKREPSS